MSRIGNIPIEIPSGVDVAIATNSISVRGSKGKLEVPLFAGLKVRIESSLLSVSRENDTKLLKQKHGLVRSLLANAIQGVSQGFIIKLLLSGVGYRASMEGKTLQLALGFSHEVFVEATEGISFEVKDLTNIHISGIDKQKVGDIAAIIRKLRPPEPYKGKGIRYEGEIIRLKAGKSGKK